MALEHNSKESGVNILETRLWACLFVFGARTLYSIPQSSPAQVCWGRETPEAPSVCEGPRVGPEWWLGEGTRAFESSYLLTWIRVFQHLIKQSSISVCKSWAIAPKEYREEGDQVEVQDGPGHPVFTGWGEEKDSKGGWRRRVGETEATPGRYGVLEQWLYGPVCLR